MIYYRALKYWEICLSCFHLVYMSWLMVNEFPGIFHPLISYNYLSCNEWTEVFRSSFRPVGALFAWEGRKCSESFDRHEQSRMACHGQNRALCLYIWICNTCMYSCRYPSVCWHTWSQANTQTHTHTHIHTHIHTCTHTHRTHTHTHTHTHTPHT